MNISDIKIGDEIVLPALSGPPVLQAIGRIYHALRLEENVMVTQIEDVKTSPRITERLFSLSNGHKIIITQRAKLNAPTGVDGILSIERDSLKWIFHVEFEQFRSQVTAGKLPDIANDIANSWLNQFRYAIERLDSTGAVLSKGLRPPQIGGLYAIGAHWSLTNEHGTVVMPTGTGKTETILATLVGHNPGKTLIVVPSKALRDQTARKCISLGLLRALGNIPPECKNPLVGVITKRPHDVADLEIFEKCNVVVSTMAALGETSTKTLTAHIASKVQTLIVDEAHHVAAESWLAFREEFKKCKVLQFTATPYRRDGKLVDGKPIFQYGLGQAQEAGYFKKISFMPVYEIDEVEGDRAIATKAIAKLRADLAAGYDHILMARCESINRASNVLDIYNELASDLNPVLVHSQESESEVRLESVVKREGRIVVCVNMLGEGFDLPQLKIAAVHDTHKSLAVLLQFTGRFTRNAAANIGDATVIANIADQNVSSALERLYSEDADWNLLLNELSSEAAKSHARLIDFLNSSRSIGDAGEETVEVSHHLLRPIMSTLVYDANKFTPNDFYKGLLKTDNVHRVWLNDRTNTLFFVTKQELRLRWSRSKNVLDRLWQLFVLHFDEQRGLLYLASSDKSSTHQKLAEAVGATGMLSGDTIFRSLGRINRLIFRNAGLRKHGRRNLSFASYTGADVGEALSISERKGSSKNNFDGAGWEGGKPVTIGCSIKGRVWARDVGTIPELIDWCEHIGDKLRDSSISTANVIQNVLIPKEITAIDEKTILCVEWPIEILRESEERVLIKNAIQEWSISMIDILPAKPTSAGNKVEFALRTGSGTTVGVFALEMDTEKGFKVTQTAGDKLEIEVGVRLKNTLEDYFSNYPPLIQFVDLSELNGNLLIESKNINDFTIPPERFEEWDWSGVDFGKESIIKDGVERKDSIQWHAAQSFLSDGFELIFNDDAPGEAADLVCLKEEADHIRLVLAHCKFTSSDEPGERIKDIVEVCSQAVKSVKWKWKFKDLCQHILRRNKRLVNHGISRFIKGDSAVINHFMKLARSKEIRPEILIIQPGISKGTQSDDQTQVFAATLSYLKETIGCDLDIICSA